MRTGRAASLGAGVIAVAAYLSFGGSRYYKPLGSQQDYSPVQPLPYSHALHAGKLRISCLYCHHGATKSDVAGVPSLNICMNCHSAVQQDANGNPLPGLQPLLDAWQKREPIEWTRVHRLPSYARFSHRAHVGNRIACQTCHGPVAGMERMRQFSPLSMGWCVDCHRGRSERLASAGWRHPEGPLDCAACHR